MEKPLGNDRCIISLDIVQNIVIKYPQYDELCGTEGKYIFSFLVQWSCRLELGYIDKNNLITPDLICSRTKKLSSSLTNNFQDR